jgi:hypothetical protein
MTKLQTRQREHRLQLEILRWARAELAAEMGVKSLPPMTVRAIVEVTGIDRGTVFYFEREAIKKMRKVAAKL